MEQPDATSPPGVATCLNAQVVQREVDVPYTTSVSMRCTFGAPPSGSFTPMEEGDENWFYRGWSCFPCRSKRLAPS